MSRAPALMIGARLAGEPGRGRRAVPVRSALVGAIAGVIGVVGCLTFRAGIQDAVARAAPVRRRVGLRARAPARRWCRGPSTAGRRRSRTSRPPLDARLGAGGAGRRPSDADVRHPHREGRAAARACCAGARRTGPDEDRVRTHHDAVARHCASATACASGATTRSGHRGRRGAAPGDVAHRLRPERLDDRAGLTHARSGPAGRQRRGLPARAVARRTSTSPRRSGACTGSAASDLFAQAARCCPTAVADLARIESLPARARRVLRPARPAPRSRMRWSRPCAGAATTSRCCARSGSRGVRRAARSRGSRRCSRWRASSSVCRSGSRSDGSPGVGSPTTSRSSTYRRSRCSPCFAVAGIAIALANVLAAGPAHAASPHPPSGGAARRVSPPPHDLPGPRRVAHCHNLVITRPG